ncbi:TNF receptor-associated factor 5-like isoform X2 [Halichondria panicea]|uniref:TNF receptor-associated factor 5-like isoform X2 n=1 Tax=Halichondria panicea TaxID=6063 RepID=UPI00312B382A
MASGSTSSSKSSSEGYDYQFVEEPSDDLKCLICLCVAKDPQQHGDGGCGKIFCTSCIDKYKTRNDKCPNCRKVITTFKDERSNRDIQSLKVKCTNRNDGCQWVGELRYVDDHLKTCDYAKLRCPNRCGGGIFQMLNGGGTQLFRKDLQKHLDHECPRRQYSCPHCQKTDEYKHITGNHTVICPKIIIECSNAPHCKTTFPRETKHTHLSTCQYQEVACKYQELGCKNILFRKDLQGHENDDNVHLRIAMTTVIKIKKQCTLLNTQLNCSNMKNQSGVTSIFKMPSFKEKKENNIEFFSDPFYTDPRGYKILINIDANGYGDNKGTHVSVWVYLMRGEYDDQLEFPFKGTIKFELLNQLEDKNHFYGSHTLDGTRKSSKRVIDQERSSNGSGVHAFIPHGDLGHNATKNCQYLQDDCLVFRISVDVPSYKPWLQCTN